MKRMHLLVVPLVVGVFLAACAAVFGLAYFIGWVATRFLPLDAFQATLIGLGAVAIVVFGVVHVIRALAATSPVGTFPEVVEDEDDEYDESEEEDLAASHRPPRKWAHGRRRR